MECRGKYRPQWRPERNDPLETDPFLAGGPLATSWCLPLANCAVQRPVEAPLRLAHEQRRNGAVRGADLCYGWPSILSPGEQCCLLAICCSLDEHLTALWQKKVNQTSAGCLLGLRLLLVIFWSLCRFRQHLEPNNRWMLNTHSA